MIAFGPVPSRRLGHSLGINNIPPKTCSYSCVYCQVGRTTKMQVHRQGFYEPDEILLAVRDRLERAGEAGAPVDYLSFVPDGEPTLDLNLGFEIEALKQLGIPIAVITNGSLLWHEDVREDLARAHWVSLKVDAVDEKNWRRVNRPHGSLWLATVLDGMLRFAQDYTGHLMTETMLIAGVNDGAEDLREVASFLARLRPERAYLSIPTRPPHEKWVHTPDEGVLNRAYHILSEQGERVEYLTGCEGDAFASTGAVEEDLLGITAVHPMREDAVRTFLARAGAEWSTVRSLVEQGQLVEMEYEGRKYYGRRIGR